MNEKELVKQIKKSKDCLIWTLQDGINYITNRHWAVRFKDVPKAVMIALYSMIGEFPKPNSTLFMQYGVSVEQSEIVNVRKVMETTDDLKQGNVTNVLIDGTPSLRVVKCEDKMIYVNDDYMKMTTDENPLCSGLTSPLHFNGGDVVILPVRSMHVTHTEIVQELIANT